MAETQTPVWLLGAPFSGLTWLAGVLGTHPQLYATPQLHLTLADDVDGLLDIFATSQGEHGHGLLRTVAEVACGGQTDAGVAAARGWLEQRRKLKVSALLAELAARVAPRRLVIPDAETALRPYELLRLLRLAPDAPLVQLVRHPYTQGRLMSAWGVERLFVPMDYKDYSQDPPQVEPQIPWLRAQMNLDRAAGYARLRRITAEDLDRDFLDTLAGLCQWLGVDADPVTLELMADPGRWPYAGLGPAEAPGGLEPDVLMDWPAGLGAQAPAGSLENPLPWRDDGAAFDPQVQKLARGYGY
ncbi:sulfotransferase [Solimonas sp. K1W22B-7]|uniref:sulfotransferase n=1 Tax=Solimonas sp. K1W22B-7 TaxID=2303331 RepID=UPI0013C467AA|nr:sulfotransferase [Solimonas sp. K1W22B-7]